jgi:hypothetical protein
MDGASKVVYGVRNQYGEFMPDNNTAIYKFIERIGAEKIAVQLDMTSAAVHKWKTTLRIRRVYYAPLEQIARDSKALAEWKAAFLESERAHKEAKK